MGQNVAHSKRTVIHMIATIETQSANGCGMWMILPAGIVCGCIGAWIGKPKGRCWDGLLLGIACMWVGWVVVYYLPPKGPKADIS